MNSLYHHSSKQTRQLLQLSGEATVSSSLLLVMGQAGTGKTHLGKLLERKYAKGQDAENSAKDPFPWKPHRYNCYSRSDSKMILLDLLEAVEVEVKNGADRMPKMIGLLVEALCTSEISLLFLDNAHRLKSDDRDMIQEVAKQVAEEKRFGLVMTSEIEQAEFEIIRQHPTALATVVLKHLDVVENLHALKAHDERFTAWVKRLADKESDANELALNLRKVTDGNFQRIASLCLSLKTHVTDTSLTIETINKVIEKRGGSNH